MDPISVTSGVMSLVVSAVATAKTLYDLRDKYKNAESTITAIYTESMVVSASLSQIQSLQASRSIANKPDLHAAFDIGVTGCKVVFSCLQEEVQELAKKAESGNGLQWTDKAKMLWREDTMKELLQQLRGQQTALTLLIQGLQMESLADIKQLLHESSATWEESISRSKSLCASHPKVKDLESVFEVDYSNNSTFGVSSAVEFDFDDVVVNSKAYRRAMALAQAHKSVPQKDFAPMEGDLIDFDDPEEIQDPDANELEPDTLDDLQFLNMSQATLTTETDSSGDIETYSILLNDLEQNMLPFMPPLSTMDSSELSLNTFEGESYDDLRRVQTVPNKVDEDAPPPLPPRRSVTAANKIPAAGSYSGQRISSIADDSSSKLSRPSSVSASSIFSQTQIAESSTTVDSGETPVDLTATKNTYTQGHLIWLEYMEAEKLFIERLDWFRLNFREPVLVQWPVLAKHLDLLKNLGDMARTHENFLLRPIRLQIDTSSSAICDAGLFKEWLVKAKPIYQMYHQRLPHAENAIRLTISADKKFRNFLATLRFSKMWDKASWEDFVRLPVSHLEGCRATLERLASLNDGSKGKGPDNGSTANDNLRPALMSVGRLHTSCQSLMKEFLAREEVLSLHRKIYTLDSRYVERLELTERHRKILYQGPLAFRLKGRGPWEPVHVVLLDNFFFWGKSKAPQFSKSKPSSIQKQKLWVLEPPMPLNELLLSLPNEVNQSVKTTLLDGVPRASILFQFFVRADNTTHALGAFSLEVRQQLVDHIQKAADARRKIIPP